jgi:NhaA family Na+:H+ antiporter
MAGQQETKFSDLTFIGGESRLARFFARPFKRFLAVEAAGGVLLIIATVIALVWVNSPWGDSYDAFWNVSVDFSINGIEIFEGHSLASFVNDALMAVFFFVVGLEIKRELVDGQLQNARDAALPAFAALGGMVVPAALYFIVNAGGPAQDGWGIPMATDIAFAVGIVSLLGDRMPRRLKVFLLSLAIVDDIGAIIVIALFYSSGISLGWLIATAILLGVIYVIRRLRVWWIPLYVVLGAVVWWTTFRSGVHATIAGVALGLLTPAAPLQNRDDTWAIADWLRDKPEVFPVDVRYASFHLRESVSVAERLETAIHPITSYIVIPIFALANAGVRMNGEIISAAFQSRVLWGIILGLVVGKTVGITAFTLAATKLGLAKRPSSLTLRNLVGLAMIAGIGFTVSLFVNSLAFGVDDHHHDETAAVVLDVSEAGAGDGPDTAPGELAFVEADDDSHGDDDHSSESSDVEDNAKIGILFASLMASVGGLLILSGGDFDFDDD